MFTTDAATVIGALHTRQGYPNQDFALAGILPDGRAFAAVADGCSSGGDTATGGRLQALAVRRALATGAALPAQVNALRDAYVSGTAALLTLPAPDLLATSLWAVMTPSGVVVSVTGDGAVVFVYEHGLVLEQFMWNENMPYYPSYRLSGYDMSFTAAQTAAYPLTKRTTVCTTTDTEPTVAEVSYTVAEGMVGRVLEREFVDTRGMLGPLRAVALFSDGVEQVEGQSALRAATELTTYRSTEGRFAARRMQRYLEGVRKVGVGPLDDLATAVIAISVTPS